jgi:polyphosphate kinase 2 (PPK2 family)
VLGEGHTATADAAQAKPQARMKRKQYERELRRPHGELVAMQAWVKASGAKVCVVFEGGDTAGKGGTIKAITERVSRGCSVSSPCPPPPNASSHRCACNDTYRTFPPGARS